MQFVTEAERLVPFLVFGFDTLPLTFMCCSQMFCNASLCLVAFLHSVHVQSSPQVVRLSSTSFLNVSFGYIPSPPLTFVFGVPFPLIPVPLCLLTPNSLHLSLSSPPFSCSLLHRLCDIDFSCRSLD